MIQVKNLSKSFNDFKAVNNIDLNVKKGEIFGLLGPNGAGKSTTINMLSSVLKPDNGSIILNGINLKTNIESSKKIIGIVPQEIALYDEFSAFDNLLFFGKLFNIKSKELIAKINELLVLIGLESRKNDLVKTYSGGMKRRINIAVALLHDPKILLMDEPTVGVDPQSRNRIFEIIENLNIKGLTIIYTTHYMEEVERLCDTIAIMDSGKIIAQGSLQELQNQCRVKEKLKITFENISENEVHELTKKIDFSIMQSNNTVQFNCSLKNDLNKIINYCTKNNLIITNIKSNKANLETVFLELTGKVLRD